MADERVVTSWPAGLVYRPHSLSEVFPILEGEAFRELVEDIRAHGVLEPVTLLEGQVLDGRNRYLAARAAGLRFEDIPVTEFTGDDPAAYVVSRNLHRRHLDPSQRAMAAARIETAKQGRPGKDANLQVSRAEAAALLNVSERTVASAAVVLDHGVPELAAAVDRGAVVVSLAAEIARLPEPEQVRIVTTGPANNTRALYKLAAGWTPPEEERPPRMRLPGWPSGTVERLRWLAKYAPIASLAKPAMVVRDTPLAESRRLLEKLRPLRAYLADLVERLEARTKATPEPRQEFMTLSFVGWIMEHHRRYLVMADLDTVLAEVKPRVLEEVEEELPVILRRLHELEGKLNERRASGP
jgi:hypothetical protein